MNISAIFIRRPIATILLMFGLLLVGIFGYRWLPISDLPNVDFPTIAVSAQLPGASPETMASSIATPLEQQFSTIAGISSMSSSSTLGRVQITLQFDLDRDIDAAAQDVQSAISAASRSLPDGMPSPPTFQKVNPAAAPILYLALSSEHMPLSLVDQYAESILAKRISMISGVAQVSVFGAQKYAVRIRLNPDTLVARDLSVSDVAQAVKDSNVNLPTGSISGEKQNFLVQASGQLKDAAAYRPLIVAYRNGAPIRLDSLGEVIDSVENDQVASWYNNTRAIVLAVQRQPGTNTIEIVDQIKKVLPTFEQQLPPAIKLNLVFDRSESIRASIHDVKFTLILACILVVLVIFLFLRNYSAAIIPSITLPLSIIGTFAFMHYFGYSLNNLSLLALTLAVGFVVDDAIVMLENIVRHMEMGKSPIQAALDGSKQIGFTIVSMTISLVVVFFPVFFMGGILGRLMHEFAATICIVILLSGFISLTLTPMMCSRILKPEEKNKKHNIVLETSEKVFQKMLAFYQWSLNWTMKHRRFTISTFVLSILLTIVLLGIIPKGFLPSEDTGQLFAYTEADTATSFPAMVKQQQQAAIILKEDPAIDGVVSIVGAGGASSNSNTGRLFVRLKPRNERDVSADEIIERLRPKLANIPGLSVYLQNTPSIRVGGSPSKSPYQFTLQDIDIKQLNKWAPIFLERMSKLPALTDVTSDQQMTGPQIFVDINRDKAAALGVTPAQIENTLATALGGGEISTIYTDLDSYSVILELEPNARNNPLVLSKLYIRSNNNELVPLDAVATLRQIVGPQTLNHRSAICCNYFVCIKRWIFAK